ncbi:PREDICTED: uncharacterized protein LOC107355801 isoform X2 [Acropora digitifera]|uniref:uncharacterized protein LOC107355801 isoform X2 n=1 Tax=Acropora digitifera TaxID=70779 RepID=UPI00077A49D2|nr:PREDICTED: uncharacterized protein LOC107355801 isoform X2 [Acropora digitifera]
MATNMGNTETSTSSHVDSYKGVNPGAEPEYLHEILTDDVSGYGCSSNSAQENVETVLSRVKVCKPEAVAVENRLRSEYFSKWDETCEVIEATAISVHNLKDLVSKLEHQYRGVNFNIRKKIQGIHWAPSWSHKVFEFTFGDKIDSGEVYFGIICLAKSPDGQTVDAVSSLYKLNFTLAREKVVETETFQLFGILPVASTTTVHYRKRNLGYFSKKQISNFCRTKAMEAFKSKGFIHHVPYVTSLSAVDK